MKAPSYSINRADVVDEVIDGEAILINLKTGSYYSLENTGCVIWEWLKSGPISVIDLPDLMERHFENARQTMTEDTRQFLEEMAAEGLLHISENEPEHTDTVAPESRSAFSSPLLAKYTDMEALLLIDPIHDVTPTGWPERQGKTS